MPTLGNEVAVSTAQRAQQLLVANGSPVDEHELVGRVAAIVRGQPREAGQQNAFALGLDGHGVAPELVPKNLPDPPGKRVRTIAIVCAPLRRATIGSGDREVHGGMSECGTAHDVGDRGALRPFAAKKLQPCGRGMEQVAHLDHRAVVAPSGDRSAGLARIHADLRATVGTPRAGANGQPRDRADGRERLTTKAECAHVDQVVIELGGAMPLQRQRKLVGRDAAAIVDHAQQGSAPATGRDLDARCPRVESVLDQLLRHRCGAFHDLAGGNAVHRGWVEARDRHGRHLAATGTDRHHADARGRGHALPPIAYARRLTAPVQSTADASRAQRSRYR